MPLNWTGACQLHIPNKDWADDPQEKQNYEAIEQWSYRLPGCWSEHAGILGPVSQNLTYASTTLPDNRQFYIDFAGATDPANSFGPNFDITGVNRLGVLVPGLVTWQGYFRIIGNATPVTGSWGQTTVNDIVTGNISEISRVPLLCQQFGAQPLYQYFPIGGSSYIDRPNQLQIDSQWQTNGSVTSFTVDYQVQVNHFPWPKGS